MDGSLSWPLERAVRVAATRTAVIDGERTVDYAQLHRRVSALGRALEEVLHVAPGERVAVLAENSLEHLECWLAVPAYGRVIADLNHRLAPPELAALVEDCDAHVLITDDAHLTTARELRDRCATLRTLVHAGAAACPDDCLSYTDLVAGEPVAPPEVAPETPAAISYTGGTTGLAKGVVLSHANLLANAKHNLAQFGHRAEDRYLHAGPMFHVADTSQTFCVTWVGAGHVVMPRFEPAAAVQAIDRHGVTLLLLVPTMIRMLVDHLDAHPATLTTPRALHYAASPMDPRVLRRAMAALPSAMDFVQGYGMTEASPSVTFLDGDEHRRAVASGDAERLRSVGRALPGVQVAVRDAEARELAPGEVGEVWVRGPNVMLGYHDRPEATAAALVDGWYRTGDAGRLDEEGYLHLVDRIKDMIISGGENVYSAEVELTLLEHPAAVEAAVFGVPDAAWGERVHAVVVTGGDAQPPTAEELIAHCRGRIAGYKVPRSVELRDEPLPKSGPGKVLKHLLREPHWRSHERRVS